MQFLTRCGPMSNEMAEQALNTALLFDAAQSIDDVHLGYDEFLAAAINARAYANEVNDGVITTSPMSGKKGDYYYPARSPALVTSSVEVAGSVFNSNTTALTSKQIVERYFTVQASSDGLPWSTLNYPVFTGQNGPSTETSLGAYWPSSCMMLLPKNKKGSTNVLYTYSSRATSMYSRNVDSFWHTYSGNDGGYNNAVLDLTTKKEAAYGSQTIQNSVTPTVSANLPSVNVANDNLLLLRPISHSYSYSGLNQFSSGASDSRYATTGNTGFTRDADAAYTMRLDANTELPDDADVTLVKALALFKCDSLGYMLRATVAQDGDVVQSDAAAVGTQAQLTVKTLPQFMTDQTVFAV